MKLTYLALKNYRRFRDVEIELPDGLVGIIGANGAGKSSLMEAVSWVLFGNEKNIVRTDRESVKLQGSAPSDPCRVVLDFEFERTGYRIEREMKGKNLSMTASLFAEGKLMASGAREVTEAIENLLGMDYKSFFISVFAQQKELNALTSLQPAKRREEIMRMLGIEDLDSVIRHIRDDARLLKSALDGARKELTDDDGNLMIAVLEKNLDEVRKNAKAVSKEIAAKEKELAKRKDEKKDMKKDIVDLETKYKKSNALQRKLASLESALSGLREKADDLSKEISNIEKKLEGEDKLKARAENASNELKSVSKKIQLAQVERDEFVSAISELKAENKQLESEMRKIQGEVKNISDLGPDSECPTCKRKLEDTYQTLLKAFDKQISTSRKKIAKIDEKVVKIEENKYSILAMLDALRKRERLLDENVAKFKAFEGELKRLNKLREGLESNEKKIEEKAKELKISEKELAHLKFNEKAYAKAKSKLDELVDEILKAERGVGDLKKESGKLESQLAGHEKEIKRLRKLESSITAKIKEGEILVVLETTMKNFKQHMISRIRPSLSRASSQLMADLTDGKYTEITLNEDYEISMADDRAFHPIDRFSGGEKDLANLCLRLAISQIIAERSGTSGLNFIILDEIFGSQDVARRKAIFSTMNSLGNRFKQMFLITHMDEVKEMMGSALQITASDDGTSHAEVTG